MANEQKTWTQSDIDKLTDHLVDLPPRPCFTKAEVLAAVLPVLRHLKDKGYSQKEIAAEIAAANGPVVSERTIARALATQRARRRRVRRVPADGAPGNISSCQPPLSAQ
jgi:hypothetical protein